LSAVALAVKEALVVVGQLQLRVQQVAHLAFLQERKPFQLFLLLVAFLVVQAGQVAAVH
jgi:hypothetical protein